jgi:hypothetical protein
MVLDCWERGTIGATSVPLRYFSIRRRETKDWSIERKVSGSALRANLSSLKTTKRSETPEGFGRKPGHTGYLGTWLDYERGEGETLTDVKAMEGVNTCPLITVKCQNETSVTTIGDVFLTTYTSVPSQCTKFFHEPTHQMQFHNVCIRDRQQRSTRHGEAGSTSMV